MAYGNTNELKIHALLSGANEVPPVVTVSTGQFEAKANLFALRFKLAISRITGLTQAHIHLGQPGVNGPIVAFLYPLSGPTAEIDFLLIKGVIQAANLVGPLAGRPLSDLLNEIRMGNAYVNVHTAAHPGGEIRGQLRIEKESRKCKKDCKKKDSSSSSSSSSSEDDHKKKDCQKKDCKKKDCQKKDCQKKNCKCRKY